MFGALMVIASLGNGSSLYADVSLGAWLDTNVNHAAQTAEAQAAGAGDLSLVLGIDHAWDKLSGWAEGGYDFTYYPEFSDFTSHTGMLAAGASWDFSDSWSVRLRLFGSGSSFGDSARDGFSEGGALGLRWRPLSWLRLSMAAGPSWRQASDEVFSVSTVRAGMFVSVLPARWLDATAGYLLAATQTVLYSTVVTQSSMDTSTSRGRGRGRQVTTFGETVVATREPALMHIAMLSATFKLPLGLYATASYTVSQVEAESQAYLDQVLAARVGWLL